MRNHLMVDIETLDTQTSAVVVQVGYCLFDASRVLEPFEMCLSIDEQLALGRTVSGETLRWWMSQPDIARQKVFEPTEVWDLSSLAGRLRTYSWTCNVECVWSHGPAFDMAILKSLLGTEVWDFRSLRDTRTLAMLAPHVERPRPVTKHSAGDDARAQAQWVQAIWKEMGWPHRSGAVL